VAKKSSGNGNANGNGKTKTNVSAIIREYLKTHSDVGPTAAAAEVSKQLGKEIPPSYISNVKNLMEGKGRKKKRPVMSKRAKAKASGTSISLENLQNVKSLVQEIGADNVRQLVDVLS
jgi:hypothetical protein